jgi:hypothetical protein
MEHQYPGAISPDENMLAELMLPDQTHVRTQDWTMFFLHKDAAVEEEETAEKQARRQKRRERKAANEIALLNGQPQEEDLYSDDTDTEDEEDGREGPPLMYVLNLVNTKQDNTVKRLATSIRCQLGNANANAGKRCCCESNGNMYQTFVSSYLQGQVCSQI